MNFQKIIKDMKQYYHRSLKNDKKYTKLLESKEFLSLFIEMILRNKNKKSRGDLSFIPYDLILFKYLE